MAAVAVDPLFMSECTFTVASSEYSAALSSVMFTPSSSTVTWKGLAAGSTFTKNTAATWVCALAYAQDFANATSLANYLHENEGNSVDATFVDASGASIAATIIITPGAIGGAVDTFATGSVSLGVQGKPAITIPSGT